MKYIFGKFIFLLIPNFYCQNSKGADRTNFELDEALHLHNGYVKDFHKYKLLVYTVATEPTDGFLRYRNSAATFDLKINVLGLDEEWEGGDVREFPGGGQKVNLFRKALIEINDIAQLTKSKPGGSEGFDLKINSVIRTNDMEDNTFDKGDEDDLLTSQDLDHLIVLFTDSYDVIMNGNASDIVTAFLSTQAGILFGSEVFCWPDTTLAVLYPETRWRNRYLNSGVFMGFYKSLTNLLEVDEQMDSKFSDPSLLKNLLQPDDDDQLFYTHAFLNKETREKLNIKLDYENRIFINLNGIESDDIQVVTFSQAKIDSSKNFASIANDPSKINVYTVFNKVHSNVPLIIHGNGDSKTYLNYLSNYGPLKMSSTEGCLTCKDNTINLRSKPLNEYPIVFLHIHVDKATPFFREFLYKILELDYPKTRIILDIYSNLIFHDNMIEGFLTENAAQYLATDWYRNIYNDEARRKSDNARDFVLHKYHTNTYAPTYLFTVDSECHLDNPKTLILLIEQNKPILAPLLARPGKMWTNFWGALSPSGYYARSEDYVDIVTYKQQNIFNVPFISSCYLIHRSKIESWYKSHSVPIQMDGKEVDPVFPEPKEPNLYLKGDFHVIEEEELEPDPEATSSSNDKIQKRETEDSKGKNENNSASTSLNQTSPGKRLAMYVSKRLDSDMAFCLNLRYNGDYIYVTNLHVYGHLINCEYYETEHFHNDLYQIFENPKDWEETYVHPEWRKMLDPDVELEQPCPDVYWFPILTERFCDELVEEMENIDEWSGGKHEDKRLAGGYENVPTDDTHMKQIGMENHWLHILKTYVSPIQVKVYPGYHHDPPEAVMNFVVRYKPTIQSFLRPHHDSSTFTINIALNRHNIDYTGGGVKFLRYNCSVIETRKGWAFIHPGRLTHYHEGLLIKSGTRYLLVSFVDP